MSFFRRVKDHFVPSRDNAYRPHLLRRSALIALLAVVILAEGVLVAGLLARQSGNGFLAAIIQGEIIALTNRERAQNNVGTLRENTSLDAAAQAKADDMARVGYFAHVGPGGKQPWAWLDGVGYDYQYAGENLAVRFVDSKDVVNAWMLSPTHRANIVKPVYIEMGVGIAQGVYKGQPATFVVQYFASPFRGRVLGAETAAPAPPVSAPTAPSSNDSLARSLGKLASEPRATTGWILGGVAALLMLALAFAFFHHVQIQSRELLLPGAVVAGIALTLIMLNNAALSPGTGNSRAASAYSAAFSTGLEVGTGASIQK